jgi:dihydroanticapsin dehydrogenase
VDLDDRRVVITGAASGIGRAAAELFARHGAAVTVADRDVQRGKEVAGRCGDGARFVEVDVSDEASVEALMKAAAAGDGLDAIVNVAGIQRAGNITEFPQTDWDEQMAINVRSCFLTAKHGVPHLRKRDHSAIVNVSSLAGLKGFPGAAAYAATKAAILGLTYSLALELAPDGIRVNALCPGWVDTPFNDPAINLWGGREKVDAMVAETVPLGRQSEPPEAAEALLFLASDRSAYMTGKPLVMDGGLSA